MTTSPAYESYASVYDAIGQGRFSAGQARWALDWLAGRGAHPARVLDLACGAGDAALVFAAAGCAVVGVDRSRPMLAIAQGKARDARRAIEFFEADIRHLSTGDERPQTAGARLERAQLPPCLLLPASFELATCFYDSLNYLTEDGDLKRVFAGVDAALRRGGFFIFDANTASEYATWDERDVVTYDGRDCLVYNQLSYDPATGLGQGRIVWFVREIERWWRGEETHTERAWDDAEICDALANAGLALVARLAPAGAVAAEGAPRVVYVARREPI